MPIYICALSFENIESILCGQRVAPRNDSDGVVCVFLQVQVKGNYSCFLYIAKEGIDRGIHEIIEFVMPSKMPYI